MKKLLLLMFAFVGSVTAWAQTNLLTAESEVKALGGTITTDKYTDEGKTITAIEESSLKNMLTESGLAILLPQPTENWTSQQVANSQPVQGFYIKLGDETKTVKTVKFTWETADVAPTSLKAYLLDEEPTGYTDPTNVSITGTPIIEDQSYAGATKTYSLTTAAKGKYLVVQPAGCHQVYGVKLKLIEVYDDSQTLDKVTASSLFVLAGETLTLAAYDASNVSMSAEFSATAGSVSGTTFTAPANSGTVTITGTANGVSKTTTVYVLTNDQVPTVPAAKEVAAYIYGAAQTGTTVWQNGWDGGATLGDEMTIGGQKARIVSNLNHLFLGNTEAVGATAEANFQPSAKNYGQIVAYVFSSENVNLKFSVQHRTEETGTTTTTNTDVQAVSAGTWTKISADIASYKWIHAFAIVGEAVDGKYPTVLLSNIYFAAAEEDTDTSIATLTANVSYAIKDVATDLGLVAKNAKGTVLDDVAYSSEQGTYADGKFTFTQAGTATVTGTTGTGDDKKTATTTVSVLNGTAKTPEEKVVDVIAVYSDTYGATTAMAVNNGKGTISDKGWNGGYGTAEQVELAAGDNTIVVSDAVCFGIHAGEADLTNYDFVNVSIYAEKSFEGKIVIEGPALELPISLEAGKWNDLRVALTGTRTNAATWVQMYVGSADNKNNVIIDNLYFSKFAADEILIGEESDGVVAVTGTLNATNKSNLTTVTASAIDLTYATIADATGTITTGNVNTIFFVKEAADAEKIGSKNVVIKSGTTGWIWAVSDVTLTDTDGNEIYTYQNYGHSDTYNKTVTYTRTIAAGKYVTTCLPIETDIPTGATAYELSTYADGVITFTKVTGNKLSAGLPYVLYAESGATLTMASAADINFGTKTDKTAGAATFQGTYKQLTTDGTQYILSDGNIMQANGAKIGSFRAYFTGVTAATNGTRAIFYDGDEPTAIGRVVNGEVVADGAYTLSGQRVALPTKGLYIVGGKKVVVK